MFFPPFRLPVRTRAERLEGIERRKRERALRRQERYVEVRLFRWVERQGKYYDVGRAFALMDKRRREYRAKAGLPEPPQPEPLTPAERERRRRSRG